MSAYSSEIRCHCHGHPSYLVNGTIQSFCNNKHLFLFSHIQKSQINYSCMVSLNIVFKIIKIVSKSSKSTPSHGCANYCFSSC